MSQKEKKQRNLFKSLRRRARIEIDDIHREYLIAHALVYFLGSTLIAKSASPKLVYGFLNPVFAFMHEARYVVAGALIAVSALLCYASFAKQQRLSSFLYQGLTSAWAFAPLLFFVATFLNDVVDLLKSGENSWFALVEYLLGLLLFTAVILWLVVRRWKRPGGAS